MLQLFPEPLWSQKKHRVAVSSALCDPQVVIPLMIKSLGWSDICSSESYLLWGFICPFLTVASEYFISAVIIPGCCTFCWNTPAPSLRFRSDTGTSLLLCWKSHPCVRYEQFICTFGVYVTWRLGIHWAGWESWDISNLQHFVFM